MLLSDGAVRVKASLDGDVRRFTLAQPAEEVGEIAALTATLRSLYALEPGQAVALQWVDADGDGIPITTAPELDEARSDALERAGGVLRLALSLPATSHADPVKGEEEVKEEEEEESDKPMTTPTTPTATMPFAEMLTRLEAARCTNPAFVRSLKACRRLVTAGGSARVLGAGLLPDLVAAVQRRDEAPDAAFEAAWALTNLAAGETEDTQAVASHPGAIAALVELLGARDLRLIEQGAWALANIAGDSPAARDTVLAHGALHPLLAQLAALAGDQEPRMSGEAAANLAWALGNLCRGRPRPELSVVRHALPTIVRLLRHGHRRADPPGLALDLATQANLAWAVSYIAGGKTEEVEPVAAVVASGACRALVDLVARSLSTESVDPCQAALRALGNVCASADNAHTTAALAAGLLPTLALALHSPDKAVLKQACWILSNVTAGTNEQVQAFMDAGVLQRVAHLLQHSAHRRVRREAAWVIANLMAAVASLRDVRLAVPHLVPVLATALTTTVDSRALVDILLRTTEAILVAAQEGSSLTVRLALAPLGPALLARQSLPMPAGGEAEEEEEQRAQALALWDEHFRPQAQQQQQQQPSA